MSKQIPRFKTDEEAEQFLEQDLTDYLDPKNFTPVTFELLPKTKQVNSDSRPRFLPRFGNKRCRKESRTRNLCDALLRNR